SVGLRGIAWRYTQRGDRGRIVDNTAVKLLSLSRFAGRGSCCVPRIGKSAGTYPSGPPGQNLLAWVVFGGTNMTQTADDSLPAVMKRRHRGTESGQVKGASRRHRNSPQRGLHDRISG